MRSEYVLELIKEDKRVDGRNLEEIRPIVTETGMICKAEGSARVKFGETDVLVGVKLDVGEPFPDTPNNGILITSAEFAPIASPEFEPGPPGEDAIELARVVDRAVREGKAIDLEKLCIKKGEKVWSVFIDIHVLNHKGNLIDCSALAAILALMNTKMLKYDEKNDKVIRDEFSGKLPIIHKPLIITLEKIGNKLVVDPYIDEERASSCRLSIGVREDNIICAMQKGGDGSFTLREIEDAMEIAIKKSKEIRKIVKPTHLN